MKNSNSQSSINRRKDTKLNLQNLLLITKRSYDSADGQPRKISQLSAKSYNTVSSCVLFLLDNLSWQLGLITTAGPDVVLTLSAQIPVECRPTKALRELVLRCKLSQTTLKQGTLQAEFWGTETYLLLTMTIGCSNAT